MELFSELLPRAPAAYSDGSAGTPTVYASDVYLDDFAVGSDDSIFAATQFGEILRLMPDGSLTTILTGTLADASSIYIVNNGGAFLGLPEGPLDASIVRLSVDTSGVITEGRSGAGALVTVAEQRGCGAPIVPVSKKVAAPTVPAGLGG